VVTGGHNARDREERNPCNSPTSTLNNREPMDSFPQTHESAEALICCLMMQFKINPTLLQADAAGISEISALESSLLTIWLKNMVWRTKSHMHMPTLRIGWLREELALTDIPTFELHCSCIPTMSIVMDIDVMLMQYGPLSQNKSEEARSRFFSPVRLP